MAMLASSNWVPKSFLGNRLRSGSADAAGVLRQLRAQHRREIEPHDPVADEARPVAPAPADGDIGGFPAEIDDGARGDEPDGDIRMLQLKRAEMLRKPLLREGGRRVDDQRFAGGKSDRRHGLAQHGERFRHLRRQPLAGLRQADLARTAQEERLADILLQQLDLVADGRLRHAELLAGLREAAEPGGGFEDAQRVERKLFRKLHG
jgi:hypothetical protein